jgi:transposase
MKNTQNQKISQIKNDTLVVGIDVAKETHYARAFDYRGIELARLLKFSNTVEGFKLLTSGCGIYVSRKARRRS